MIPTSYLQQKRICNYFSFTRMCFYLKYTLVCESKMCRYHYSILFTYYVILEPITNHKVIQHFYILRYNTLLILQNQKYSSISNMLLLKVAYIKLKLCSTFLYIVWENIDNSDRRLHKIKCFPDNIVLSLI